MPNETLPPIKIVFRRTEDIRRTGTRGGERKVFGKADAAVRRTLLSQVGKVHQYFATSFTEFPDVPAVARVQLKEDAIAKSHRPSNLFSAQTCPVIGIENFGELLVSVKRARLRRLETRIEGDFSKNARANISTVKRIRPYATTDVLEGEDFRTLMTRDAPIRDVKVRLFEHHNGDDNARVRDAFFGYTHQIGLPVPEEVRYAHGMNVYRIDEAPPTCIAFLRSFVGTQTLSCFPKYRMVKTQARAVRGLTRADIPSPDSKLTYPIVGIIDSGIRSDDPLLNSWVVARHEFVPPEMQDNDHGSFVAGLLIRAGGLNHGDPRFPNHACKIVDVIAFPRDDGVTEDQLISILEEVLPQHPEVKVWNLSLGTEEMCCNHGFSDLGVAIDRLQDKFGVTFITAAGNYNEPPFRGWPPEKIETDRICSPADAARCLTVGSLAHLDRPGARVLREQPSPFTRRGPGAAFLPKPEVVSYGGNCDETGGYTQMGILSTGSTGNLLEDIGTSYACPIIAGLLANLHSGVQEDTSRNLVKALLIHSAALRSGKIRARDLRYKGFGIPGSIEDAVSCKPWMATMIFEAQLLAGYEFEKFPFPMPACLHDAHGNLVGEVTMTLVYDPPLDASFGAEYCRSNVDISLGTYDVGKDGRRCQEIKIPAQPEDVSKLYEKHLVEFGFKWSPIKVYHRSMPRGVRGGKWRLKVTVNNRREFHPTEEQQFCLIVTVADPQQKKPVYNEVVETMNRQGWATQNVELQERLRARA